MLPFCRWLMNESPNRQPSMRDERGYGGNVRDYMSDDSALPGQARDAVSRGDWQQAYDLLIEADTQSPLSAPDWRFSQIWRMPRVIST